MLARWMASSGREHASRSATSKSRRGKCRMVSRLAKCSIGYGNRRAAWQIVITLRSLTVFCSSRICRRETPGGSVPRLFKRYTRVKVSRAGLTVEPLLCVCGTALARVTINGVQ